MADEAKPKAGKPGKKEKRDQNRDGGDGDQANEPPRAVIALHPSDAAIALAVGMELRVFDNKTNQLHLLLGDKGDSAPATASAAVVRCVAFSRCGKFLAAGADDKTTHLWSTDTWKPIKSLKSPKKISVVGFSADGTVLLSANKFGDIGVASTAAEESTNSPQFELFLGHYCSVITSLSLSYDGKLLAGTDRDGRVRINNMPEEPLLGCHDIQCIGFGHTDFVSCSAFVKQENGKNEVLVTGGGDGTLRMWDVKDGRELSVLQLGVSSTDEDTKPHPVLAVCPSQDGKYLIVSLDTVKELSVVSVDLETEKLLESGRCAVPGVPFTTDICRDSVGKFLLASGPLNATNSAAAVVCCELAADGTSLNISTSTVLGAEAKAQLEKCDVELGEIEKMAPKKMLPSYLHKRAFLPQEEFLASRKAAKKEEGGEAGPSSAAAAAEGEDA